MRVAYPATEQGPEDSALTCVATPRVAATRATAPEFATFLGVISRPKRERAPFLPGNLLA